MNKGFLSNKNHNLYLKKKLNYKIYTCKDCTQKKKEYEHGILIAKNFSLNNFSTKWIKDKN